MKFYKKNLGQTQTSTMSKEEIPKPNKTVDFLINKAHIDGIPNRSIGVLVTDAADLLGAFITRGIFKIPVIIYRKENMYYLYNHQLILSGAIEILEKDDDRYMIKTYGRELQDKKSGWNTSKFMNSLAVDFDFVESAVRKKFKGFEIVAKAV